MPTDERPQRADARRNAETLLRAASAVFVRSGVDAAVREIAAEAGVGVATIYRHFPTRADLVVSVFRHQLDELADVDADVSLRTWISQFVEFLVTKHGLADAMRSDRSGFEALHAEFVERLEPVCARLLATAVETDSTRADVSALALMRAVGNLCIGAETDPSYDAQRLVGVLLDGLGAP